MKALTTVSKWIAGAALAGALMFAAPQKSEAQVHVGVAIGGPVVVARPYPGPYYRPYYSGYYPGYRPYYGYGYGYYRPYGYYAPRPYYRPYAYGRPYARPYGRGWRR